MNVNRLPIGSLVALVIACIAGGCGGPEASPGPCDPLTAATGCEGVQAETLICNPSDPVGQARAGFCVYAGFGSGAIADSWDYGIRIGPGAAGQVTVTSGWPTRTFVRRFDLDESDLDGLWRLHELMGLDGTEPEGPVYVGGSAVRLAVVVEGVPTTFGAWLDEAAEGRKQRLARQAQALVPPAVWDELRAATGVQRIGRQ